MHPGYLFCLLHLFQKTNKEDNGMKTWKSFLVSVLMLSMMGFAGCGSNSSNTPFTPTTPAALAVTTASLPGVTVNMAYN
jgi:hypothetical protein